MTRLLITLCGAAVLLTGCNTTELGYRPAYPYTRPRVNDRFFEPTRYVVRSPYHRPEVRIKRPVAYFSHAEIGARYRPDDIPDTL